MKYQSTFKLQNQMLLPLSNLKIIAQSLKHMSNNNKMINLKMFSKCSNHSYLTQEFKSIKLLYKEAV